MTEYEHVVQMLQPMLQHATANGLWLKSIHGDICVSPDEMRKKHANNELCWGPNNWELINPKDLIINIPERLEALEEELSIHNEDIIKRMGSRWNLK